MRVLINLENTDDIREIYLEGYDTLLNLKIIIEAEFNIPKNQQLIKYQNKTLSNDSAPFSTFNVIEDDILVVSLNPISQNNTLNLSQIFDNAMKNISTNPMVSFHQTQVKTECNRIKNIYLSDPGEMSILFNTDPELAEAIVSDSDKILEELISKRIQAYEDKKRKEMNEYNKLLNSDSQDPDAQKKIADIIKWKNIDENLKMAHEYLPESFCHIDMLFINIEINKQNITALVDTGAQTTIISQDLAEKCGLFNLCDTRYSGIAKGVGTSKILGVVHAAQIKVGNK